MLLMNLRDGLVFCWKGGLGLRDASNLDELSGWMRLGSIDSNYLEVSLIGSRDTLFMTFSDSSD